MLTAIENAEAPPVEGPDARTVESKRIAGSVVGAGAAEVERRQLTESDLRAILETEVYERSAAAREYERLDRDDVAQRLWSEAEGLSRYLAPRR